MGGNPDEAAYRAALDSAVRSLGQREHGRRELASKLSRKGHPPELVGRVLDYLAEQDLQSDSRFAEEYVRSRIRRGYGPVKIRRELTGRGVAERDLERLLTSSTDYWLEVAGGALERKFGAPPEDREGWNVQARFLARRGFPSDLIFRLLGAQHD